MAEESSTAKRLAEIRMLANHAAFPRGDAAVEQLLDDIDDLLRIVDQQAQTIQQHEARIASLRRLTHALRALPVTATPVIGKFVSAESVHRISDELLARLDAKE